MMPGMNHDQAQATPAVSGNGDNEDDGPGIGLTEALTWIGEGKRLIAMVPSSRRWPRWRMPCPCR